MDGKLRIAVADDDVGFRETLRRMVLALGHEVGLVATNGAELVESARQTPVDLAIVDLEMPVMDGLAAAEELWQAHRTPVILLTGHADFGNIVRDQEPIATYLLKPVSLQRLGDAIDEALRKAAGA